MHARVLRYLDEVVRCGSIRKAAEKLHVAPTAINRQILELEQSLGTPLFERIHKRLRLTPLGEMVLGHVRQTLREHQLLLSRVEEYMGVHRGEVSLAVTAGLAGSLIPPLAHAFRRSHPGIVLRIADLPVAAITAAVDAGTADLGLAYLSPGPRALRVLASSEWKVGAVVAPGHPLAGLANSQLADCLGSPLILPAPSLSLRALLDASAAQAGVELRPAIEASSTALVRRLVALGAGLTFLNPLDMIEERARGTLIYVPLRDESLAPQTLQLVARAGGGALSEAARQFADAVAEGMAQRFGCAG